MNTYFHEYEEIRLLNLMYENKLKIDNYYYLLEIGYNSLQIREMIIFDGDINDILRYSDPDFTPRVLGLIRDCLYQNIDLDSINFYLIENPMVWGYYKKLGIKNLYLTILNKEKVIDSKDSDFNFYEVIGEEEIGEMTLDFFDDDFELEDYKLISNEDSKKNEKVEAISIFHPEIFQERYFNITNLSYNENYIYDNFDDFEVIVRDYEDSFESYYRNKVLYKSSLINASDEKKLASFIKVDKGYYERFFMGNVRLAYERASAKKSLLINTEFPDLIQESLLGLIVAMEKFEPDLGYKFSTYATWHLNQKVTRFIGDNNNLIRIPIHAYEKYIKLATFRGKYILNNCVEPSINELRETLIASQDQSEIMDYTFDNVEKITNYVKIILDLEDVLDDLDFSEEIQDGTSVTELCGRWELIELIHNELKIHLTDREYRVLYMRFGLHDSKEFTLEEVGSYMGVARERIRQIEAKALRKLRFKFKSFDIYL
ncbi:sigma-70 family RNA polymerase sigma factor [Erysipelothrix rhusiopathiae]|nr:sigma-70 family RNA polymerase sigma factor [Erysipelothrix rhusiopathiae]